MASDWQDLYLNARQYLKMMWLSSWRFSDLELKLWFYEMRELWSNKSDLEILYDIKNWKYEGIEPR